MMPREQETKTLREQGFHNAHARTACTSVGSCSVQCCVCMHFYGEATHLRVSRYCNITWLMLRCRRFFNEKK